jgi:hypothetical protein
MSTGLDAYIEQDKEGKFVFGIEDPYSNSLDPEFIEEGPFATPEEMFRAIARHANPGGWDITLLAMDYDEFDARWEAFASKHTR